jgi:unsaturated rhamnogalacturonyl hydrolase
MHSTSLSLLLSAGVVFGGTVINAQLPIRNTISDTQSNPLFMLDVIPSTTWLSETRGDAASFLLDEETVLEAEYTIGKGGELNAYQLLASTNYRDWTIAGQGMAAEADSNGDISPIYPTPARYLRFVSLADAPVGWELLTGSMSDVEAQFALFQPVDWGDITEPENIVVMLDIAFDWQMDHLSTRQDAIGWVNGAFYSGVSGLYAATGDPKYRQAILDIGNSVNWTLRERTTGKTFYHADDHCIGQSWLELYMLDYPGEDRWIADVRDRLNRVMANPLPGRQDMNWCDALYMSPPNYSRMASVTGDESYLTFIDTQWWDVTDFLYDPEFGLFYRDSSYFDDREPNGMPVFWSRGNGWVIGGLVRLMQYIPPDWPTMPDYENLLREMAGALAAIQGPEDGLWSSSLLYPEKYDMERETSGSAFFTYGLAWGVNEGILDPAVYGPVIEKAWAGLATMLTANGALNFIQQIGAGPARNNGLLTDKDYGYGAFLLAGIEMMRYYENKSSRHETQWATIEALADPVPGDPAGWTRVDDFEGSLDWIERKNVPYSATIVPDPFDAGGSGVLSINTGVLTPGDFRLTKGIPPIPEGGKATVYQRFSYDNPEIDVLFGISDVAVVDAYGDYENGLRVYFNYNQMEARAGNDYERIGDDFLQLETWYEAWTLIDNETDTYDVYIRGGSNYPGQTLLRSGIPFRNGTRSSIVSYAISYNSDWCEGTFMFDDLYVFSGGLNLSRPAGVHQTAYSPWSAIGRDRLNSVKSTDVGFLWDEYFPWVYHSGLGGWCHVHAQEHHEAGYWVWNLGTASWTWLSSAWPGWAYDAGAGTWYSIN